MVAPVGHMTVQTVLFNRGMLPHIGPPFLRMTGVAEFIHRVALEHLCAEIAMRVMAVGAGDLPLDNRVVGLPVRLGTDITMTAEAEVRLLFLKVLSSPAVSGVAVVAGQALGIVLAHTPGSQLF